MKKLITLFFGCFLFGCATQTQPNYDTTLFFMDPNIKLQQLEARHYTREKDGHMLVNITGIGTTNQVVYYKVEWYNEMGMPIKTIMSTWKSASIVKNMPFNWDVVSPNPQAKSFKIMITKNIGNGILN